MATPPPKVKEGENGEGEADQTVETVRFKFAIADICLHRAQTNSNPRSPTVEADPGVGEATENPQTVRIFFAAIMIC
jgi:hypothetical protein